MIKSELGQTMLETSMIIAVLVLVIFASIPVFRGNMVAIVQKSNNTINGETIVQINNNPPAEVQPEAEEIKSETYQMMQKILGTEPGENQIVWYS